MKNILLYKLRTISNFENFEKTFCGFFEEEFIDILMNFVFLNYIFDPHHLDSLQTLRHYDSGQLHPPPILSRELGELYRALE